MSLVNLSKCTSAVADKVQSVCYLEIHRTDTSGGSATGIYVKDKETHTFWILTCGHFLKQLEKMKWILVKFETLRECIVIKKLVGHFVSSPDPNNTKPYFSDFALIKLDEEIGGLTPLLTFSAKSKVSNDLKVKRNDQIYAVHYGNIKRTDLDDDQIEVDKISKSNVLKITETKVDRAYKPANLHIGFSYVSCANTGSSGGCILNKNGDVVGIIIGNCQNFDICFGSSIHLFYHFLDKALNVLHRVQIDKYVFYFDWQQNSQTTTADEINKSDDQITMKA